MRGIVVVEEASDYQAWLREQQTFAQLSAARTSEADVLTPASSREPAIAEE